MPGDIIGFGGRKGGAFDSLKLIFNTCGPEVVLDQMRINYDDSLDAINLLEEQNAEINISINTLNGQMDDHEN